MRNQSYLILTLLFILGTVSCSTESTPVYQFTGSVNPAEAGTITPSEGEFDEGTDLEIRATANQHWVFTGWSGGHSGSQNPDTITINTDRAVTALFEKKEYTLSVNTEGSGTVEEQVVQAKQTEYPHGTSVQLTATADNGWSFEAWSGAISGSENPSVIQIEGEASVTASFSRNEYTVTTNVTGEGEISRELISGTETEDGYLFESELELTANPEEGWAFVEWRGDLSGSNNPAEIFVDSDQSITAVFEPVEYTLDLSTDGEGSVTASPDRENYFFNDEVELTAEPEDGWEFSDWSGDLESNENPITIRMSADKSITAKFEELCLDPEACVATQFYASVIVGNFVFDSNLSITNNLPDPILLTRIRIQRGDGGFAADSENIDEEIQPGSGLSFSADYLPQPRTDQFQQFTAQFFITYKGSLYVLENRGSISSFKATFASEDDIKTAGEPQGIQLIE